MGFFEEHLKSTTGVGPSGSKLPLKRKLKKNTEESIPENVIGVEETLIRSVLEKSKNKKHSVEKEEEQKFVVVVDGYRNWNWVDPVVNFLMTLNSDKVTLVSTGMRGAAKLAENTAKELGIEVKVVEADWDGKPNSAGKEQIEEIKRLNPDFVVAFHGWIANSISTKYTIKMAKDEKIPYVILNKQSVIYEHGNLDSRWTEKIKEGGFEVK